MLLVHGMFISLSGVRHRHPQFDNDSHLAGDQDLENMASPLQLLP